MKEPAGRSQPPASPKYPRCPGRSEGSRDRVRKKGVTLPSGRKTTRSEDQARVRSGERPHGSGSGWAVLPHS